MSRLQILVRIIVMLNAILQDRARPDRWAIFRAYLRISCKYLFLHKLLRRNLTSERFLGHEMRFFRYGTFKYLFEEIFVEQQYRFATANPRPTILDCGSNIGMAVLFFKHYYPGARVTAFEPDEQTFAMLSQNVAANRLEHVTLVRAALSDKQGTLTFYTDPAAPGGLCMSAQSARLPGKGHIEVPAVTLSAYLTEPVDFLKLDIEGAEEAVFAEVAAADKLQQIRVMVIEYHHHIDAQRDRFAEFLALLERHGFGYQISASHMPLVATAFQDILILAYRKQGGALQREAALAADASAESSA
ncbi:MAG: FkbM family methyltransferase [Pirellulales bacterium]